MRTLQLATLEAMARGRICGKCQRMRRGADGRCLGEKRCSVFKKVPVLWDLVARRDAMLSDRKLEVRKLADQWLGLKVSQECWRNQSEGRLVELMESLLRTY
jgi:hypothetical protein